MLARTVAADVSGGLAVNAILVLVDRRQLEEAGAVARSGVVAVSITGARVASKKTVCIRWNKVEGEGTVQAR